MAESGLEPRSVPSSLPADPSLLEGSEAQGSGGVVPDPFLSDTGLSPCCFWVDAPHPWVSFRSHGSGRDGCVAQMLTLDRLFGPQNVSAYPWRAVGSSFADTVRLPAAHHACGKGEGGV